MTGRRATLVVTLAAAATCAAATPVDAGGMVLPTRGVRAFGRAGAFIAGADDLSGLWLNPAGLAHLAGAGMRTLLFDASYVQQAVTYARVDSGGNPQPAVSNQAGGLPIPTVAGALGVGDRLVIAGGIVAPYAGLHQYADDGPQRYASVSLSGSSFVILTVAAAYAISPRLRVGATVQDMIVTLASRVVLSGCPGQVVCAPEDPEFDALAQVKQTSYLSPSGSLGVQYDASPAVTLGASLQAPTRIWGSGSIAARLPTSGFFNGARVVGDRADVSFTMPPALRAGIELHPGAHLRVEAAVGVEFWAMHDEIRITPKDVRIENAAGVGTYTLGPIAVPRRFENSLTASLGGELHVGAAMVQGGYAYETSAVPTGYLSVLTVDAAKHLAALGAGYEASGWSFGVAGGLVLLASRDVALDEARLPQQSPIRDQPAPVYVNAGHYDSHYLVAGVRAGRRF